MYSKSVGVGNDLYQSLIQICSYLPEFVIKFFNEGGTRGVIPEFDTEGLSTSFNAFLINKSTSLKNDFFTSWWVPFAKSTQEWAKYID